MNITKKLSNLIKRKPRMADSKSKKEDAAPVITETAATTAPSGGKQTSLGIRLMPVDNSDQPVLANYTALNVSPGMIFIDFGFLEPGMLSALPRVAKQGGKLPESVNGKLAVRVAMGYDGLANLHQQLGQVVNGLREARAQAGKKSS
jgi:hypothetical protein